MLRRVDAVRAKAGNAHRCRPLRPFREGPRRLGEVSEILTKRAHFWPLDHPGCGDRFAVPLIRRSGAPPRNLTANFGIGAASCGANSKKAAPGWHRLLLPRGIRLTYTLRRRPSHPN